MSKTENERIAAKTRDSRFKHVLINEFELSPKEAEGNVATAEEVYDLKNYSPSSSLVLAHSYFAIRNAPVK